MRAASSYGENADDETEKVLYTAAPVLAVALLFSFFMDWLYDNDNKYTYKGAQAISGILVLDRQALEQKRRLTKQMEIPEGV